jgi:uncharacterized protein (TIGR02145 family)
MLKKKLLCILFFLWIISPVFSQTITSVGTDFWVAFPPNFGPANIELHISSNVATSGSVFSAYPGVNQNFTVVPGIVTQVILPPTVVLQTGIEDKGIRITSVDPITVYGLDHKTASSDAFLALPVNALGLDYTVLTYKTTLPPSATGFSVVATQDGTVLTVYNHQTNSTSNVNLNTGQTFYVRSAALNDDVTGSRIQSNFPVAVFGSVECVNIPLGCQSCDHIMEEMFPYYSWGKNFVTVPLAGRDASGDVFRVLSAQDGTTVTVNGTLAATINTGEYYEAILTGYNSISTNNASLLAQYAKGQLCSGLTGDPLMVIIPPEEQFLTNYTVVNVAGFTSQWVNIAAPFMATGLIYQDGVLIPASAFVQIGTTNFYGAQRSVTQGSHTFSCTVPFGVFVYGWNNADSYGYPGGCSLSPVGTVNSITLSPLTASGQLNVTSVCLTANVLDNLSNPVAGVLVNFHVSGINPLNGTAFTDASGNAVYCYTQTGVIPGTDNVYADCFGYNSNTSVVTWTYTPPCTNPDNGGTISSDQSGCGSYTPATLNNLTTPTGQTGTLEYKWQQSIVSSSSGFTDIAGSNSASFNPGIITQTTWYKRLARVDCMQDWNGAVASNVLFATVTDPLPVSLGISASGNNVCTGTLVNFTASPTNGGIPPAYQWKVNGTASGTNNPVFIYTPANGDVVSCILTSSEPCTSNNPATSNAITMVVNPLLAVSVSISTPATTVCAGTLVNYMASAQHGGTSPSYQWKVNGITTGPNNSLFSYIPLNGDIVSCVLTSDAVCPTGNPATSNSLTMTVNPNLLVSISISTPNNPFCQGNPVTFTASPGNGGTLPVYQWKVNGVNAGTGISTYTLNPLNGDQVNCVLTSNLVCTQNNPATSNSIAMTEIVRLPVGISITATPNPFCPGTLVSYHAVPTNGGTSPAYQWIVNGITGGSNSADYSYAPQAGDSVRCIITSNLSCITNNPASSGKIIMSPLPAPVVSFTYCFDSITILSAAPFQFKGGIPVGGTYSGQGVSSGVFTPSSSGVGVKTISYTYTNMYTCSSLMTRTISVLAVPSFSCGQSLTDIRDNKVYPTVQIGSQCWMQQNLNYGSMVQGNTAQTDNCINEKYCYSNDAANCTLYGGLYQWDEVMAYSASPGAKGLCPPGWHMPTQSDWLNLFNSSLGQGLAAKPLQDFVFNGFRAKAGGFEYSSFTWKYQGFASIYWTSNPYGSVKAISHGMNQVNFSVSDYYSNRSNAFAVRCLKD